MLLFCLKQNHHHQTPEVHFIVKNGIEIEKARRGPSFCPPSRVRLKRFKLSRAHYWGQQRLVPCSFVRPTLCSVGTRAESHPKRLDIWRAFVWLRKGPVMNMQSPTLCSLLLETQKGDSDLKVGSWFLIPASSQDLLKTLIKLIVLTGILISRLGFAI